MMSLEVLKKRLVREQKARKSAEKLLEQKALELYLANQKLKRLNENLQEEVNSKTTELQAQKARLTIVLESLQEGIVVGDQFGLVSFVNQPFCDIFQTPETPESIIGSDGSQFAEFISTIFHDSTQFLKIISKMVKDPAFSRVKNLETKDGRILEIFHFPIQADNITIGNVWRVFDKTDQFNFDKRIRQSEEKYRSIMENMELGLMEVNPKGVITKVYDRFCKMMGYQAEELIGQYAAEVFLTPEYKEVMRKQDQRRVDGFSDAYEIQMKTKDKRLIWVMISGAPFFNNQGVLQGSIGIHYDITEQKNLQKELEIARNEAEKARDAEKQFLANMSHEIRNPINSIIGMTNLLYDTNPNEEQLEYLQHINYSSELLLALVSDILDISKITEGQLEIKADPFHPKDFFRILDKTMEFRLSGKPVDFSMELPELLPEVLLGDTTCLNQILLNLLGNAIKFTDKGEIRLKVSMGEENETSTVLNFLVEDTGIGIPIDKLEHVFNRFGQVGQASKYEGTGLGLPITRELIELNGGKIKVKSNKGKGTKFYFNLVFKKPSSEYLKVEPEQQKSPETWKAFALTVLIVEDNETNRLYLEQLMKKWGFQYRSCTNGEEALDQLKKEKFDLILMDIRMPVMDGYETTIRLRSSKMNPNVEVPIIALTASALLDEKEKALAAGMNFHLTKPFTPQKLSAAIGGFFKQPVPEEQSRFEWPAPFNAADLDDHYGTDLSYVKAMFEIFLKNISHELSQLDEYILEGEWEHGANLAHKIKPNFAMIGLPHFSKQIGGLENILRKKTIEDQDIRTQWIVIKLEVETVLPLIQKIISKIESEI